MIDPKTAEFRTVRGYQLHNQSEHSLTPAMEDYLEMVYRLCVRDGYTRVGKLAECLQVKPSSASKMTAKLCALHYLRTDSNDCLVLTEEGLRLGEYLLTRHDTVVAFLHLLGKEAPLEEAELLEHAVEPQTMLQLRSLLDFWQEEEDIRERWVQHLQKKSREIH